MEIRKLLFGRNFYSLANCPECSATVEWEMNYADFTSHYPEREFNEVLTCQSGGFTLQYHLPRENDVSGDSKNQILKNCIDRATRDKKMISINEVPPKILEKLEADMEANSPLSSSMINLTCPECAHQWAVHFSVFEFLWSELDQWARRLLHDISTLAANYGWSEQELLNMNPVRRSYYLSVLSA